MGSTPVYQKVKRAAEKTVRVGAAVSTFGQSEVARAGAKMPGQIKDAKAAQKDAEINQANANAEDAADEKKRKMGRDAKRKSMLSFSQTGPLGLAGDAKANTKRKTLLGN